MPRIRGASIEEHHEVVWAELADATRQLLSERDYDSINMGHIAARAGLARNTLYNYAPDKNALVVALIERAGRPAVEKVARIADRPEAATDRLRAIVDAVLDACSDQILQLMFLPGAGGSLTEKGPDAPMHAIVVAVEDLVREGVARKEFREVGDVRLGVELLSGVMRAGAERIGRDPAALSATISAAQEIILASLVAPPDPR